jgi:UDP-2,3-diacylglucosamine hydrolase
MRAFFVSDLHLVGGDDERTRTFVRFLESLREAPRPTHLFLVGDVFDFWIADHEFFQDRFRAVVSRLRELIHLGVEVHYFEGNHDLHLSKFWQHDVGANVHADHAYFELGGRKIRVEHGDLINPDDKGYLFLRKLLRHSVVKILAFHLPDSIVRKIGERASHASRHYTSNAKSLPKDRIRGLIRAHAERVVMEEPFDVIISGHVHVTDDYTFKQGPRSIRSVNLGSWFDGAKTFVMSEQGDHWLDIGGDGKPFSSSDKTN